MTSFQLLKLVTMRELVERGRSKSYLLSMLLTLLLLTAAIVLPQVVGGGPVTYRLGTLGEGNDSLVRAAEALAAEQTDPERELEFEVTAFDDEAAARDALEAGEVELVVIDGAEVLRQGSAGFSGSPLQEIVQEAAAISALEDTGADAVEVAGILNGEPLPVRSVQGAADEQVEQARSLIAYGGMFLLYLAILMYGQWTLNTVAEEKASRVVEVLLSTLKPWQMLAGKILGIGLLGIGQFAAVVVWSLTLIRVTGALELPAIPVDSGLSLVVWFVLGFGVFSVLYAGAGALVSRMEDAQSVAGPIAIMAVVGFLASFQVLEDPGGTLGRVLSFVPLTAPFVVPIRVAFGEITLVEHLAAAGVTLLTIAVLVRIAGRIYAGGLLHMGSRMKLRQAWRAAETR